MTSQTLTLSELSPAALYTCEIDGSTFGIGTGDEFRDLIADGIIPVNAPVRFRLAA